MMFLPEDILMLTRLWKRFGNVSWSSCNQDIEHWCKSCKL